MALGKITYSINGKKKIVRAKVLNSFLEKGMGLMFKKKSPPLFFMFNKSKKLSIHSFFCRPFRAIWLDEKFHATRVIDVKTWKFNISGNGKYLLEMPLTTQ